MVERKYKERIKRFRGATVWLVLCRSSKRESYDWGGNEIILERGRKKKVEERNKLTLLFLHS